MKESASVARLVEPSCSDVSALTVSALDVLGLAKLGARLRDTNSGQATERGHRTEEPHE